MKNLFCYLAAVLATAYFAIMYQNTVLVVFLIGEVLLVPVLLFLLALMVRGLRLTLRIPIPVSEAGSPVEAEILVENRSWLPVLGIDVWVQYQNLFLEERAVVKLTGGVDAGARAKFICRVESGICGCLEFTVKKVRVYDYLRLFSLPKRAGAREQAVVLPRTYDTLAQLSLKTREFLGDSEEYDQSRGGDDPSEVFQLREYRPGDRIQQIHWKLSAASEDLVVKEFGRPVGCPVILFLDFSGTVLEPLWMKGFPELACALSRALVEAECLHYVVWYEPEAGGMFRQRVAEYEDVYRWLQRFLRRRPYGENIDLPELYRQSYPGETYETELQVTLDRKVYRQGELCGQFSAEQMKEALEQWEVLV